MTRHVLACGLVAAMLAAAAGRGATRTAQAPGGRERAYRANNTGVAYLEQFNYADAEAAFREALKIQPDLAIARVNLAIALLYGGKQGEAVVEARSAAKALPALPQPHYVLGLAARGDDKLEEAAAAFRRVLEIDPADAGTKIHLGQILLQQQQFSEALRLFQEALASEPYNVTAAYNTALALMRSGQAEAGRAAMGRFESLRDSAYGVTFAQTYLSQGKYAEALASTGDEPDLVDASTPAVAFSDVSASMLVSGSSGGGRGEGALTLFDADGDGDLELIAADAKGLRFFRNDNGKLNDETARVIRQPAAEGAWTGIVAGDYDNDDRPDLLLIGDRAHRLLHQNEDGTFEDVTGKVSLQAAVSARSAALVDLDHDGDLDVLIAGDRVAVLQNSGTGSFSDITEKTGITAAGPLQALVGTDYDNGRDVDVIVAGDRPYLFRNLRDGTFREMAAEAGLPTSASANAARAVVAPADVNKDGYIDVFLGRGTSPGVLALSDGRTHFRIVDAPAGTAGAIAAQFVDYDNDGLLDLLSVGSKQLRLHRNLGQGRWADVTEPARLTDAVGDETAIDGLAVGDLDGDGDSDLVLRRAGGAIQILANNGGNRNASLKVRLAGRVSNRSGAGARIEMRAGSLRQTLEASASTPAVAPADLLFGLGARQSADVVRVLWPSGILQAETNVAEASRAGSPSLVVTELDRKPSSCPYLFTWNGRRFEFVTDFMGGGEMGAWLAPSMWNTPDADEYVRIRDDQLQPRDGSYELRLTNELEEALFFDRVQLLAVDHPADVEVYPNEGLRSPPRPAFALTAARGARPPSRAVDEHGHDVLSRISRIDRVYPDDFPLLPIRGYAEPHDLVLDLAPVPERPVLLLTGWTDYAFSNDNVAAFQARTAMRPPLLQVKDARGRWQTVIEEIGFPVGRPQTIVVNLEDTWLSRSREVRIVTNMRIYWDQVLVASAAEVPLDVTPLEANRADLRWRGLSAEVTPDGREPYSYDYDRVSSRVPWKVMVGRYTREGDVRPLLTRTDDMFVISRPGDEIALSFPALAPPPPGRARTFMLFVHGYSKEMNPRSALPDTVGPLPFRAMSGYPYPATERYPQTREHREYQERYNTRLVTRPWPSIDMAAAGRAGY